MIPKKIHYCWLSGDPYPEDIQKYMQTWQEKLPDYEFVLWDTNKFDLNSSLWCRQAFDAKKYAFAADYIRMYAIYTEGGIYLDCDIEVLKSFNDAIAQDIMIAYEQKSLNVLEAGCFGAKAEHPYIKKCLDYYQGRDFIKKDGTMDMRFLPEIMYEIMRDNFDEGDIVKFKPTVFTSKSSVDGTIMTTSEHYCIHHFKSHYLSKEILRAREENWQSKVKYGDKFSAVVLRKAKMFMTILKSEGIRVTLKRYKESLLKKIKNRH